MGSPRSNEIKQKIKTGAKYTGYTIGGAVMLASAVAVGLFIVNKLFEPEFLSSLGKDNVFTIAAAVGFVVMAVALIGILIHDYRKKTDEQLQQDNKTLKDGIKAVNEATDLDQAKAEQPFKDALQIAQA